MSIGKTSNNSGFALRDYLVPKVNGNDQHGFDQKGSDDNKPVPRTENTEQERKLGGVELAGDTAASRTELVERVQGPSLVHQYPESGVSVRNRISDQVQRELDRNGDGIVSQPETFKNAREYNIAKPVLESGDDTEGSNDFSVLA